MSLRHISCPFSIIIIITDTDTTVRHFVCTGLGSNSRTIASTVRRVGRGNPRGHYRKILIFSPSPSRPGVLKLSISIYNVCPTSAQPKRSRRRGVCVCVCGVSVILDPPIGLPGMLNFRSKRSLRSSLRLSCLSRWCSSLRFCEGFY